MVDWYTKLGDTGFPFKCQLAWEGGYDSLSGCTVKLRYKKRSLGATAAEITGTVEDEDEKIVSAVFSPAAAGTYQAEWEITWPNDTVTTFPEDEYLIIEVLDALESSA